MCKLHVLSVSVRSDALQWAKRNMTNDPVPVPPNSSLMSLVLGKVCPSNFYFCNPLHLLWGLLCGSSIVVTNPNFAIISKNSTTGYLCTYNFCVELLVGYTQWCCFAIEKEKLWQCLSSTEDFCFFVCVISFQERITSWAIYEHMFCLKHVGVVSWVNAKLCYSPGVSCWVSLPSVN